MNESTTLRKVPGCASTRWPALAVLGLLLMRGTVASSQPLTLDVAVALALDHQPSLASARARIAAAKAEVDLVDVESRPTISASGSYIVSARQPDSLREPEQQASASLLGSWLLWDFGQRAARRATAIANLAVSSSGWTQAERALLRQVEDNYVNVLGARAQTEVRVAVVLAEQRHLDEAHRLVAAGSRTAIDVAQARARLASARVAQVRSDNAVALAIADLERAIGTGLPKDTAFATALPSELAGEEADIDALLTEAEQLDPEVAALAAQQRADERAQDSTRLSTRPTLSASTSAGVDALGHYGVPPEDRRTATSWSIGLSLSWQLYDGGARAARLRAGAASLRSREASRAARIVELRFLLQSGRLSIKSAKAQIAATQDSVVAATEQVRLAEAQFSNGLASSAELADAQDALTQALGDAVDATYQLATARIALRHLLGRVPR
jgi:outer membrane protein